MPSVDIIIPAYNEALRIEDTVRAWLASAPADWTITFALNGCTDNTRGVIERAQKDSTRTAVLLEYPEAIGKGGAILRGWQQSTAEIVGFVDADLSTSPEEMKKIVAAIDGHDGVIASRFRPGATVKDRQSTTRTLMSKIFAACVKLLFGMPYTDTQCGAKIFRREALLPHLHAITSHNMAFDVELLWRLHQAHCDIIEVPTFWIDKKGSASLSSPLDLVRTGFTMLKTLVRVRFS